MRLISKAMFAAILAAAVAASVLALPALGQDGGNGTSTTTTDSGGKTALRIGWQQDPRTLNPFVGLDEEDWNIWSINYDLLVNFSPDDLSPAPGIAKSWDISDGQEDRHLPPRPGQDLVRRQARHLRGRQVVTRRARQERSGLHRLHVERLLDRDARRGDRGDQDQASGRAPRRRPLRLHPPEARLGQGPGQPADRLLPAAAADGRLRAVRRDRVQPRAHRHDVQERRTGRARSPASTRSSSSSTATRTRSSALCSSVRST